MSNAAFPLVLNPTIAHAEYAVRGSIPARASAISAALARGDRSFLFDRIIYSNMGNPLGLGQQPLTFNRQVMALVDAPFLLDDRALLSALDFPQDVVRRAEHLVAAFGGVAETGAYTEDEGCLAIRQSVAKYIGDRDRASAGNNALPDADPGAIFLTNGASPAVDYVMRLLLGPSGRDAVLIPIPQYPLYTALIAVLNGQPAPYTLDEARHWSVSTAELERAYQQSVAHGHTPRALVVINPGNPTGHVLDRDSLASIATFALQRGLVVLADEVYQANIYVAKPFLSMRSVVLTHADPAVRSGLPVMSFHSTSKGMLGECGRRGGYVDMLNAPDALSAGLYKLASMMVCSNVNGQVMTDLMVRPPQPGDASHAAWEAEYRGVFEALSRKAKLVHEAINAIEGLSVGPVEGAMYAFVRLDLPEPFVASCTARGEAPDAVWAMALLEATGIVVVPGSGFGQAPGTHHFRMTILPPEEETLLLVRLLKQFHADFLASYRSPPLTAPDAGFAASYCQLS